MCVVKYTYVTVIKFFLKTNKFITIPFSISIQPGIQKSTPGAQWIGGNVGPSVDMRTTKK